MNEVLSVVDAASPLLFVFGIGSITYAMSRRAIWLRLAAHQAATLVGVLAGLLLLTQTGFAVPYQGKIAIAYACVLLPLATVRGPSWISIVLGFVLSAVGARLVAPAAVVVAVVVLTVVSTLGATKFDVGLPRTHTWILAVIGLVACLAGGAIDHLSLGGMLHPALFVVPAMACAYSLFVSGRVQLSLLIIGTGMLPLAASRAMSWVGGLPDQLLIAATLTLCGMVVVGWLHRALRLPDVVAFVAAMAAGIGGIPSATDSMSATIWVATLAVGGLLGVALRFLPVSRRANRWFIALLAGAAHTGRHLARQQNRDRARQLARNGAAVTVSAAGAFAAFADALLKPTERPSVADAPTLTDRLDVPISIVDRAKGINHPRPLPAGRADRVAYPSALRRRNILVPGEFVARAPNQQDAKPL